jgi:aerobic carbon-monoxide dehydrogenase medium subunit
MIPVAFRYRKATTIEEAVDALSAGEVKILAGGHSLIPVLKLRLDRPAELMDISGIENIKGIFEQDGEIVIGAATTHNSIAKNRLIREKVPFFSEAASLIGDMQVRNHGTIGGSVAHADPAADWPAAVLAADASIEVQSLKGKRTIKATEFFVGLFETLLTKEEIIISIRIPVPPEGAKTTYLKFCQPASRFAIVGCAVMRHPDGKTNIAFTGVATHAFRDKDAENAISGKAINSHSIRAATDAAVQNVNIMSDHYASEEYRKHLAKVFLRKALQFVT